MNLIRFAMQKAFPDAAALFLMGYHVAGEVGENPGSGLTSPPSLFAVRENCAQVNLSERRAASAFLEHGAVAYF